MDREKDLKFLRENIAYLFETLTAFKELRGSEPYKEKLGESLAKVMVSSLGRNFLLGLAALVDPPVDGKGNENISIRSVRNIDLIPHMVTIEKLRRYRSKGVAHNDRTTMHLGDDFFKIHDLRVDETEALFDFIIEEFEIETQNAFPREVILERTKAKLAELLGG